MEQATRATLYLGANIGGKPGVTATEFSLFLDDYVTPRFDGFTVRETQGYWKGKPEVSRELVILGNGGTCFHYAVEMIAQDYKRKFRQEAVMITFETVNVKWDVVS